MAYVLGIDLGTSSLKGLLLDEQGKAVASAQKEYPLIHPKSGYSEQDPGQWILACEYVLDKLKDEVADFTAKLGGNQLLRPDAQFGCAG